MPAMKSRKRTNKKRPGKPKKPPAKVSRVKKPLRSDSSGPAGPSPNSRPGRNKLGPELPRLPAAPLPPVAERELTPVELGQLALRLENSASNPLSLARQMFAARPDEGALAAGLLRETGLVRCDVCTVWLDSSECERRGPKKDPTFVCCHCAAAGDDCDDCE